RSDCPLRNPAGRGAERLGDPRAVLRQDQLRAVLFSAYRSDFRRSGEACWPHRMLPSSHRCVDQPGGRRGTLSAAMARPAGWREPERERDAGSARARCRRAATALTMEGHGRGEAEADVPAPDTGQATIGASPPASSQPAPSRGREVWLVAALGLVLPRLAPSPL